MQSLWVKGKSGQDRPYWALTCRPNRVYQAHSICERPFRPFSTSSQRGDRVAKKQLGTKRICPETGKKFYDLGRDPIVSPYTGMSYPLSTFDLPSKKAKPDEETAQKPADETETAEAEDTGDVEVVSLEDAEPASPADNDDDDDETDDVIPDIDTTDIDGDDVAADDDDTFLDEDDEDGGPAVAVVAGRDDDDT